MKNIALAFPMHLRAIAIVTAVTMLAWTLGLPLWIQQANAANVSQFSDTITTSNLGDDATHTMWFTTSNAMNSDEAFRIYFDEAGSNFDFTGVTDADLIGTSTGFTAVNTCTAAAGEIDLSVGANYIQGDVCTGDTIVAGLIGIEVGVTNFVNNPNTEDSYVISLQPYDAGSGGIADEGDTRVAIIEDVTVTAEVDTIFTFTINGVSQGITVNDDVTVTSGTSTATTVPFGVIAPGTPKLMAQELRVDTNAINGFAVTVSADQTLTAGNGATIDEFIDGSAIASSTLWEKQPAVLGSTDTYGHWGLTSDDDVVSSTTPGLWGISETAYVGNFVANPVEVFYHNTPVENDAGVGVGSTTVAYKVEITNLQEAAKDYTATLTYVATPVF